MNNLDGWLKKRTAEDVARANEDRRKERNRIRKATSKKCIKGKSSTAKKRSSYNDDSDYLSENDGFIVNDDYDEENAGIQDSEDEDFDENLEDEDEEDEEEMILHDDEESDDGVEHDIEETKPVSSSRRSRAAARNNQGRSKTDALSVDSDSEDDDDEEESFLPSRNHRPSVPSNLLKQKTEAAKRRHNPSLTSTLANAESKKRKTSGDSSLMLIKAPALKRSKPKPSSSIVAKRENPNDDDEELTSPFYTPKKLKNVGKGNNLEGDYDNILSSEEENTINHSTTNGKKSRVASVGENSKYFGNTKQQKPKAIVLYSDSDSSDDDKPQKSRFDKKNSHALEDTPEPSDAERRRRFKKFAKSSKNGVSGQKANRVTYSIDGSSDEDEIVNVDNTIDDDAGFDDEDLRVAMKMSMKTKKKADEVKKKKANESNDEIEMLLEDSSDEEDADQGDDYYDQEKETASNVLKSAEQLSGHVVRAMSGWFQKDAKNKEGGVVQGIIVDGALALGSIDASKSGDDKESHDNGNRDNNSHEWISQAVMAKAIPNVKLSGYQLIGVNWMALLNGMTCEVGTKGTKNVNGVLADEMGLVCIIDTPSKQYA